MAFEKADSVTRQLVRPDGRQWFELPAWGYLESVELRPRVELPNMDAAMPYRLGVVLLDAAGQPVPLEVFTTNRDMKDGQAP